MSTYLERVKRLAAERHAQEIARQLERSRSLEERIQSWYATLPPQDRRLRYTMDQLVILFGTAPGLIGTALHRLGWERKRQYTGPGGYTRYWVPASR